MLGWAGQGFRLELGRAGLRVRVRAGQGRAGLGRAGETEGGKAMKGENPLASMRIIATWRDRMDYFRMACGLI
jgi:hypothetical protein